VHPRKAIRHAVANVILAAETDADDRVYATQKLLYPLRVLPAISVYTPREKSTLDETAPRELDRKLDVIVEALLEAGENVDDAMDDMAEQIERAMDTDPYFGSLVFQSNLIETETVSEPDGDRQIGQLTMTYTLSYRSDAFVETSIDDFKRLEATYDLESEQAPLDQNIDLITVQP
jgi:hypothetical protein